MKKTAWIWYGRYGQALVTNCWVVWKYQKTEETCETSLSDKKRLSWGQRGTLTIFQIIDQCYTGSCFTYAAMLNVFPNSIPTLSPSNRLAHYPFDLSHPFRGRWADPTAGGSEPSWGCWTLNCHCCGLNDHLKCAIQKNRGRKRQRWAWKKPMENQKNM